MKVNGYEIKPDAKLFRANLYGANLTWADLRGANLRGANLPIVANAAERLNAVAVAALQPNALEMSDWHHNCGTRHCIAGWAIIQAGYQGRLMESTLGSAIAGLLLLGVEAHKHFYDSNEKALEFLRGVNKCASGGVQS